MITQPHPDLITAAIADAWRELFVDRIEAALEAGQIQMPLETAPQKVLILAPYQLHLMLSVLLPELYAEPQPPADQTPTPPGSFDRAQEYQARESRGESLYHPADADPIRDDRRALAGGKRANGSPFARIDGWS
jgi:hypothetical protein